MAMVGRAAMLEIDGLCKRYGTHEVLCGVDLAVLSGQVLALLGPNGAGKSTLVSIAAGLCLPDGGQARVAGFDVRRERRGALAHLGLAPQDTGVYPTLTVKQNLDFFARLNGVPSRQVPGRVREVAETLGLTSLLGQRAGQLSGGQRRRLHTALAVVHGPEVLLLDEPTVGADVAARAGLLDVVRKLAAGGAAILYTTHYLPEVEQLGADVAILHEGRIRLAGHLQEVVASYAQTRATLTFVGDAPVLSGWQVAGERLVRDVVGDELGPVVADAIAVLAARGGEVQLAGMEIARPSLETAYLAVTGDHRNAPEGGADALAA
jgi:ABC-2 type transport system ATP-binding protein